MYLPLVNDVELLVDEETVEVSAHETQDDLADEVASVSG